MDRTEAKSGQTAKRPMAETSGASLPCNVDAIAMKLGIEKTAMIRLRAGISYALTEAMDEGHCGLPTDQLIPLAEELLDLNNPRAS